MLKSLEAINASILEDTVSSFKIFLRTFMCTIFGILFVFGTILVFQGINEMKQSKENKANASEETVVEEQQPKTIHVEYDLSGKSDEGTSKLLTHYMESCSDVIARMYIPNTKMETAIVDTDYYFRRNLAGEYDVNGTPYVQTPSVFMKDDKNAVIYGHRLDNGEDFGALESYLDQQFLNEHPEIMIETPAGETTWKIISVFTENVATDTFDYSQCESLDDISTRDYFMNQIKSRNLMKTDDYVYQNGAQLITLSTCYYPVDIKNGRLIVVAVRK